MENNNILMKLELQYVWKYESEANVLNRKIHKTFHITTGPKRVVQAHL